MLAVCKVSEGLGGVEVRECEPKEPGVGEVILKYRPQVYVEPICKFTIGRREWPVVWSYLACWVTKPVEWWIRSDLRCLA